MASWCPSGNSSYSQSPTFDLPSSHCSVCPRRGSSLKGGVRSAFIAHIVDGRMNGGRGRHPCIIILFAWVNFRLSVRNKMLECIFSIRMKSRNPTIWLDESICGDIFQGQTSDLSRIQSSRVTQWKTYTQTDRQA